MNIQRPQLGSLVDLLHRRADEQPQDCAYAFVSDHGVEETRLTFADLAHRSREVAAQLAAKVAPGERALLLFPPGLDFIVAYFGCLAAGIIAVPMMIPRRSARDQSASILANCTPRLAITNAQLEKARPDVIEQFRGAGLDWLVLYRSSDAVAEKAGPLPTPRRDDIAFLQYTSGSTSEPKGVMVSHGNLIENLEMIRVALGNTRQSTYVSWVPLYHDMGLILNVLQSLYIGSPCVLMAPVTFIQRPLVWLRTIQAYRAEVATAPNFAFDLAVQRFRPEQAQGLDLSSWKIALNGAEPVRAPTIERFAATFAPYGFDPRAIYPAYGMAEATLLISGGTRGAGPVVRPVSRAALQRREIARAASADDAQPTVGCGRTLVGERIAIVDPETRQRLDRNRVGEVWVSGANVCKGYWRNPEATRTTFEARIDQEGGEHWLRTGDLGFMDDTGELFIAGRIKDVIIVRGNNHYPQDIENTVYDCHPALRRSCGAAFSMLSETGEEKVVLVQEVERTQRHNLDIDEITACIREAVANGHEIALDTIVLIRPGAIPKTTSGKIQRSLARRMWLENTFEPL